MLNCKRCQAQLAGSPEEDHGEFVIRCLFCGVKNILVVSLKVAAYRD